MLNNIGFPYVVRCLILATLPVLAMAQTRRPFIRAMGEGVVSVRPDQVKINANITTIADSALASSEQNATRTTEVLERLRAVIGTAGEMRTVGYSVSPNYRYPQGGGNPILTGYTTNNSIEVTSPDLGAAGRIIDTATNAGATTVSGLRFSLKDPNPTHAQALRLATQQARMQAEAIASGLGGRLGPVVSVEETSAVRVVLPPDARAGAATTTPIETGMVEVHASVVIEVELQ